MDADVREQSLGKQVLWRQRRWYYNVNIRDIGYGE
jgi:hypothetical protein